MEAIRSAESKYTAQKESHSKVRATVSSWWSTAAVKIVHFRDIIDTFVSSNPEYVALAWGTIKFLFMVTRMRFAIAFSPILTTSQATLNYRELSSNVAEAFATVGDVLPEANFLAQQLYPVEHIQKTLQALYRHVIEFCIKALRWYHRAARGILQQAIVAVKNPWPLEFEDIIRKIRGTMARFREQSTIAHQAETRHIANMLSELRIEMREYRTWRINLARPMFFGKSP